MALDVTIGGAATDSYVTLAEWQAYWAARGVDLTAHGHDSSHEANLRRAADYIDRRYVFIGYRQYEAQARQWPRVTSSIVDGWPVLVDAIPKRIKDAQCEMAYLIHEGLDPFATITTGAVKATMAKAGEVATQTEYASFRETPRIVAIEGIIAPLVGGSATQVRLGRG